jgi:serine/threonine-protein kinase
MANDFTSRPEGVYRTLGPGSRIAGYLIGEQIGAGGMAVVFRARDEVLGRLAAVKVIAPAMANDEEFRARFLRESRMVAAVDSLHIIPVYAAGEAEGLLYIATRFVAGGDLAGLLHRSGRPLDPDRAASLVAQVASALDAAHAAGLVHRDVKPQNILVDSVPEQPEHAFLSDFGLSKGTKSATRLTADGQFLGTPDYSSPEQIRGGDVDGRADQYSLACVAYVLLTGELPFPRSDTVATMFAHLQESVPLVTRLRPELSPAVNGVIARALAKAPADRYRRCADFAAALQEAVDLSRPAPEPDPWAWLARDDRAAWVPTAERPWQQPPGNPAGFTGSPPQPPGPSPAFTPQPAGRDADWSHPSIPPQYAAGWATALRENAGYANTVAGKAGTGRPPKSAPAGRRPSPRRQRRHMALIGGAAAVVLAAAGVIYAVGQSGGSHGASLASSPSSVERPSKPTLTAMLTVPGDNTVDTAWTSPDGQFIAASGQGRSIYVWNAASRSYLTTLTAPNIRIGTTVYTAIIDNVAFSADDSTLTAVLYPNVPSGAPTPGSSSAYAVYQWKLPTGDPTLVWSVQVPATVAFSNDNSTALTSQNNTVSQVTLSPELNTAPSVTLPGGADQAYPPPFELDLTGARMIYHPASNETYVWDFGKESVVAKLRSSEYTVLSPDGKTILVANPSNYPTPTGGTSKAPPTLWDVATQSNVTPADPRWKAQLHEPWEVYSWETYSEDGSVLMTKRAGGKLDLWSTVTHQYLLTITDPNYRKDGFAIAAAGGRDVVILSTEKTVNDEDEYRQVAVWATPLA